MAITPRRPYNTVVRTLRVHRLGRVDYDDCHALQQRLVAARQAGATGDILLLLEHPPTVTLGRGAEERNLRLARAGLEARGIAVRDVGRGGDVTYHGPGQLVAYPIVDLAPDRQDVRRYVSSLEETMIRVCAEHAIIAGRIPELNGAWVDAEGPRPRKIGAVGVRISRWVTMHGLALNVTTDLSHFDLIVPCGISDKAVTSLERELGRRLDVFDVGARVAECFASLHEYAIEWRDGAPTV